MARTCNKYLSILFSSIKQKTQLSCRRRSHSTPSRHSIGHQSSNRQRTHAKFLITHSQGMCVRALLSVASQIRKSERDLARASPWVKLALMRELTYVWNCWPESFFVFKFNQQSRKKKIIKKSPQANLMSMLGEFFAVHLQSIFDVSDQQSSHYSVILSLPPS